MSAPHDRRLAQDTLLDALGSAWLAGELGRTIAEVVRVLGAAPQPGPEAGLAELLLGSVVALAEHRVEDGVGLLRRSLAPLGDEGSLSDEIIGRFYPLTMAANTLYDASVLSDLEGRVVDELRRRGALSDLVPALVTVAYFELFTGRFTGAASTIAEARALADATGIRAGLEADAELTLYAYRGQEDEARNLAERLRPELSEQGNAFAVGLVDRAMITLELGLGNYKLALAQALAGAGNDLAVPAIAPWDVVEAAARSGEPDVGHERLRQLAASPFGSARSDYSLGLLARSRALLAERDDEAESGFARAIELFEETPYIPELARSHLLYGEWLRRQRRRRQARAELRRAGEIFDRLGMAAFARRTEAELLATGERSTPRRESTPTETLTPQEGQVALLAAEGCTNREIASKLFVSAATVDFHLRKVYRKLGVTSRVQLSRALFAPEAASAGNG